jgi:hypothetical protein
MAKSTVGTYKHTVWKSCATYVKLREANSKGEVKCVTCPTILSIYDQNCNAGHFIPQRGNSVLFDDAHIFPQCVGCNCGGSGEQFKYGQFLKKKYGYSDQELEEMQSLRHKVRKFTLDELKEIKRSYDEESDKLRKEKGLK